MFQDLWYSGLTMKNDDLHSAYKIGPHIVPGIWAYMFPEDFSYFKFPTARESTCGNCPKIVTEKYLPDTRCCTYNPRVPNYLLGLALENKETAAAVRQLIKEGFATPEGMHQTPVQTRISLDQHIGERFGKAKDIVCRFLDLDSGMCQQYLYRNSVCASFFCINNHGEAGRDFWERVQALAGQVETSLSQWAMSQAGLDAQSYFDRYDDFSVQIADYSQDDRESWSKEFLNNIWGEWYGREEQFYLECAEAVRKQKHDLWNIVNKTPILQPFKFEHSLYNSLEKDMKAQARADGLVAGKPASHEDLWYVLQLAHRNLWRLPDTDVALKFDEKIKIEKNAYQTETDLYYKHKPYLLKHPNEEVEYISASEHALIQEFTVARRVGLEWLEKFGESHKFDSVESISELIGRSVLLTAPQH